MNNLYTKAQDSCASFTQGFIVSLLITVLLSVNSTAGDASDNLYIAFDNGNTCAITMPSISADNGCAVISGYPWSNGGAVEFMWAKNNSGSIDAVTGWATDNPLTYCPSEPGLYRICARTIGCGEIYEGDDVYVNGCGQIDGLYIYDQSSDASVYGPIQDGDEIEFSSLPSEFYLATQISGIVESVRYTVDGDSNTENHTLFTYPGGAENGNSWSDPSGFHEVSIEIYNQDDATGELCDSQSLSFTITGGCDNVTSSGHIEASGSICSDQSVTITSTTLPSGGSGALEYVWLFNANEANWVGATAINSNTPELTIAPTESGWYRRCARRAGCTDYPGESNWVHISVDICVLPPTEPTCDAGSFLWENNIDVTNLSGSSGIPQADVRLVDGNITCYTIPGPYPSEFEGPITLSIDEVVSWDAYTNRPSTGNQPNEQWSLAFFKDGSLLYSSSYTEDLPTGPVNAEWIGSLDQDIFFADGVDEIKIVHFEDDNYGVGSSSSANSVVPVSVCLSYDQACEITVDLGDDISLCGTEGITLSAIITGQSICEPDCERIVSAPNRCNIDGDFVVWLVSSDDNRFSSNDAQFVEFSNGTAQFTATASNGVDIVDVDITYSGKTTNTPSGSPKENECETTNTNGWTYYTETNGTIVSQNHGTFSVSRMGPSFQLGYSAMHIAAGFGASGWLEIDGGDGHYSHGDINIHLGDCIDTNGNSDVSYLWSSGETTQEIHVTTSGIYTLTVTDCNGCTATDDMIVDITSADPITPIGLDDSITLECNSDYPEVSFENGTILNYEEYAAQSICQIELSSHPSYDFRNFWFHSFPSQYDKNFVWNEGYVVVLPDSTVEMFGKVLNNTLTSSGYYIHYYFETLVDYDTWIAGGGYNAGDTDAPNRLYAQVDFTKPNTILGFGEFADSDLELVSTGNVAFMDLGPRNVYGGEGVGFWIDYTGTVNGFPAGEALNPSGANHNDMYASVGECVESPEDDCAEFVVREWTVEDECGAQCSFTQSVTIIDTTPPTLISGPESAEVSCSDDLPEESEPVFEDNCDNSLDIEFQVINIGSDTACVDIQSGSISDCGSGENYQLDGGYAIEFNGFIQDAVECKTYFFYCVRNNNIDPEISHFLFGADDCTSTCLDELESDYVGCWTLENGYPSLNPGMNNLEIGTDGSTGNCGIKWDSGLENNETQQVYLSVDGIVNPSDIQFFVKAGQLNTSIAIPGPAECNADCCTPTEECAYIIQRTWTATDDCGNSTIYTQTLSVVDTIAPTLTINNDTTVECGQAFDLVGYEVYDSCGEVTVDIDSVFTPACGNSGRWDITYVATDACGNSAVDTQIISIEDTTAPELTVADDATVECDQEFDLVDFTSSDLCGDVSVAIDSVFAPSCGNSGVWTITYTASDDCDNSTIAAQTITIQDTIAPTVVSIPDPATIGCNDPLPSLSAVFTDNCDDQLDITMSMDEQVLDCGNKIITLTQTATDDCGNSVTADITINVIDDEAPSIEAPEDTSVDCDNGSTDPADTGLPTGSDDCSEVTFDYSDGPISGECPASFIRTWVATDACGNSSVDTQIISISDETPPNIAAAPDAEVECGEEFDLVDYTTSDNCSDVDVVIDSVFTPACGNSGRWDITYVATDACGNSAVDTQIISIEDSTAPELSVADDATVECDQEFDLVDFTASDSCGDVDVAIDSTFAPTCGNSGIWTISYTATDDCENSTLATQTITIQDTTDPIVVSVPEPDTIGCNDPLPSLSAVFSDNCDLQLDITMSMDEQLLDCGNKIITLTQTATDDCGNSVSADIIINVIDNEAPTLSVADDAIVECGQTFDLSGFDADDDCSDVSVTIDSVFVADCANTGVWTLTYTATDECGNSSTDDQTITIVDNTPPSITAADNATVECGQAFDLGGFDADDDCSDVSVTIDSVFVADCGNTGVWTLTYTATDACGNSSTDEQTITIVDTTPPSLTVADDAIVECGEEFDLVDYDSDDICGEVTVTIDSVFNPSCGNTGRWDITYTATDECDNSSVETQHISIEDTTAPEITAPHPALAEVDCDNFECGFDNIVAFANNELSDEEIDETRACVIALFADLGLIPSDVSDNCDDDITWTEDQVDFELYQCEDFENISNTKAVLTCFFSATDDCGNTSETVTTQIVISDNTAPVIVANEDAIVECGQAFDLGGFQADDSCGDVSVEIDSLFAADCGNTGLWTLTYTATDACGNTASDVQLITIVDTTPPSIDCPAFMDIDCAELDMNPDYTGQPVVSDECSSVDVSYVDLQFSGSCPVVYERTWTATDECGNSSTCTQILNVIDITPPSLIVADDATVECGQEFDLVDYEAFDTCGEVTVTIDSVFNPSCGNTGRWDITYTATDECDNSSVETQHISIEDTTAPEITAPHPALAEVDCDNFECGFDNIVAFANNELSDEEIDETRACVIALFADLGLIPSDVADNCDDDITWTEDQVDFELYQCEDFEDISNTKAVLTCFFSATDDCGNTSETVTTQIVISDNTAPVIVANEDAIVECGQAFDLGGFQADDSCGDISVEIDSLFAADCGNTGLWTLTYTATDECGNTASDVQLITIVDNTPPSIIAADNATVECGQTFDLGGFDADDDCSDVSVTIDSVFVADCGNTGVWTLTYTATDACGNSSTDEQTITIVDTTPPSITAADNAIVECGQDFDLVDYDSDDICSDVTVNIDSVFTPACGNSGRWDITYVATDACGNSAVDTQIISIEDSTAPELSVADDATVECDQEFDLVDFTASDSCGDVDVAIDSTFAPTCGNSGIWTISYTATDDCENSTLATQTITIQDTTDPIVVSVPEPDTIGCNDPLPSLSAVFSDNCDLQLDITMSMDEQLLDCGNKIITLTQTATDDCGNSVSADIIINVIDNEAPTLSVADDAIVECGQTFDLSGFDADDDCSDVSVTIDSVFVADCANTGVWTLTYTATDECGNSSTDDQTITIVDTTPPSIDCPAFMDIDCAELDMNPDYTGQPVVSDECSSVDVSYVDLQFSGSCPVVYERTWTATDECGNSSTCTQILNVIDITPPSLIVADDATVECGQEFDLVDYEAFDTCGEVTVTIDSVFNPSCGNTGRWDITYTATDECDNSSVETQHISIEDTTAPEITAPHPALAEVDCDNFECGFDNIVAFANNELSDEEIDETRACVIALFADLGLIPSDVADNCDDDITWTEDQVDFELYQCEDFEDISNTKAVLTCFFSATDDCGNTSETVTTQIVISDNTAPVIVANEDAIVECGQAFDLGGFQADDSCGDISVEIDSLFAADCGNTGLWTLTYTATDECGNTASDVQLITIVDNTPPSIIAADNATVECGQTFDLGGFDADDDCSDVSVTIDSVFVADCGNTGVWTLTYTATDACGNSSTDEQTITIVDTTPPSITAADNAIVECGQDFDLVDYDSDDICSDVTVNIDSVFTPACGNSGVWEITYRSTDACSNSTSAVQVITIVDITAPEFNNAPGNITVECDEIPTPENLEASDLCGSVEVEYNGETISEGCPYTITRTWTATDQCDNSTIHTQVIEVIDITPPSLEVEEYYQVQCGDSIPDENYIVSDNCDNNVLVEVTISEEPGCGSTFTWFRSYVATDHCGNSTVRLQEIEVVDTTAPLIDCPADITLDCDNQDISIANTGEATASDICDAEVEVSYNDGEIGGSCPASFIRTWIAVDDCGNSSSCAQTITIVDETAPEILVPADATVSCEESIAPDNTGEATASDNCSGIDLIFSDSQPEGECPATFMRTWIATDGCGNSTSGEQLITIVDETSPSLEYTPDDITLECGDQLPTEEPEFSDNCDIDLDIAFNEGSEDTDCGYAVTRTWTATDNCGNSESHVQIITIVDTTDPFFNDGPEDVTVECDAIPSVENPIAGDICDQSVFVEYLGEVAEGNCPEILTRSWRATDDCGNSSIYTQIITVIDETAPIIHGAPDDVEVDCGEIPAEPTLTATDNCDDEPSIYFSEIIEDDACPYTITRTWTATDLCGNSSIAVQTITVTDTESPNFDPYPVTVDVQCDELDDYTISATDNCSSVQVTFSDVQFSGNCYGTLERTWTATDACGNTTSTLQYIFIKDEEAPVLQSQIENITVTCDEPIPVVPEIEATDNCAEEVNIQFSEVQSGQDCPYVITRTWTLSDDCGNETEVIQVITVVTANVVDDLTMNAIPNPFNDNVRLTFTIPEDGFVIYEVYDALGSTIEIVFKGFAIGGIEYHTNVNTSDWTDGMYYSRLIVDDRTKTERIMKSK